MSLRRPPARRVRPRGGFTLIELLLAVVVIGILAASAVPAFANTRGKANLAKVKSDLRHLVEAEETFFNDRGTYTDNAALLGVQPSPGVLLTLIEASANGWSARAVHPSATPVTCAVYYGSAGAVSPATRPGQVACE